jgi:hypothetical protein
MKIIELPVYKAGEVIEAWRIFYWHVGIVSERWVDGEQVILSCSCQQNMVVEERMSKFSLGFPVQKKDIPRTLNTEEVLARARSKLGHAYDIFRWNCEHFVYYSLGLEPKSPQLALAALTVIGLIATAK